MRTSLNNIKAIDDYLLGAMMPDDRLLFEAKMLLDTGMTDDVHQQKATHKIIRQYSRQVIKAEIKAVQQTLASQPQHGRFMQRILNLFKK